MKISMQRMGAEEVCGKSEVLGLPVDPLAYSLFDLGCCNITAAKKMRMEVVEKVRLEVDLIVWWPISSRMGQVANSVSGGAPGSAMVG